MRIKTRAALLLALLLTASAPAASVYYAITGSTADWYGEIQVASLLLPVQEMGQLNVISMSANGADPFSFSGYYYGSNSDGGMWLWDDNLSGLSFQSPSFYTAAQTGKATWNDLIGHSYDITSTDYESNYDGLSGKGGQISFSLTPIPEPASVSLFCLGGLAIAVFRRRLAARGRTVAAAPSER